MPEALRAKGAQHRNVAGTSGIVTEFCHHYYNSCLVPALYGVRQHRGSVGELCSYRFVGSGASDVPGYDRHADDTAHSCFGGNIFPGKSM